MLPQRPLICLHQGQGAGAEGCNLSSLMGGVPTVRFLPQECHRPLRGEAGDFLGERGILAEKQRSPSSALSAETGAKYTPAVANP